MDPAPTRWMEFSKRLGAAPLAAKLRFREELGLPVDGPLILSGHQAELWHAGIVSKLFASVAFAEFLNQSRGAGMQAAWLVVDQDEAENIGVRIPVRNAAGALRAVEWRWGEGAGRTSGGLPVVRPLPPRLNAGESAAISSVVEGVEAIQRVLTEAAGSSANWAEQVSVTARRLLEPIVQTPRFAYESKLASTELFQKMAETMARDSAQVIEAYNAAVLGLPEAGMRPLDGAKGELPLWSVASGVRRRVYAADFAKIDRATLAPRGLLMTAIMRLAGCELFVHGKGGALYDLATEAWVRDWADGRLGGLKTIAAEYGGFESLAPITMVTADLRLPLAGETIPSESEIANGIWRAHHAKHDPMMLGDKASAEAKEKILKSIRERKRQGESPAREFAALQELLAQVRGTSEREIERLRASATVLKSRRVEASIAHDRTWSFALHSREALRELLEECRGAWGVRSV